MITLRYLNTESLENIKLLRTVLENLQKENPGLDLSTLMDAVNNLTSSMKTASRLFDEERSQPKTMAQSI